MQGLFIIHINVNNNHLLNKLKLKNFGENIPLSLRQSILILARDLPYFSLVLSFLWNDFFSEAS